MKRTRDEQEHGVTLDSKRSLGIHYDFRLLVVSEEHKKYGFREEQGLDHQESCVPMWR